MRLHRAGLVVLVVPATLYFVSYFHRVAPAVVAADVMRAFGVTAASLALLAAVYPYVFAVMALAAGSLADGIGPRWTLTLGGVTMAFGTALFGLAPAYGVAVLGRLLVGLGASVILVAWLTLIAAWYRSDEFATAAGFTQTVGNLGALAASSPLALLVEALGWRATFVVIGAGTLLLALSTLLLVRDRPPASPRLTRAGAAGVTGIVDGVRSIAGNPLTWPPAIAGAGLFATLVTLLGLWGVPWLTQVYGASRVEAASTLAMLALGVAVGAPAAGWLSDRWLGRRRPVFIAFSALSALCWLPLLGTGDARPSASWLPGLLFAMGVGAGALPLVFACVREVNDPARVGLAVGFCNLPIFAAFAALQSVSGFVLDARWSGLAVQGVRVYPEDAFRALFALCLAVAVAATVAAVLTGETRCRNVWSGPARRLGEPGGR